jgi:hypothetical protein
MGCLRASYPASAFWSRAWDETRHGAPIEKKKREGVQSREKQAEACLGDWRLLILTSPESR